MQIFNSVWCLAVVVILFGKSSNSQFHHLPIFKNDDSFIFEKPNGRAESDRTSLNYRLPNETYPEHYDIKLTTHVHLGIRDFQGEVSIETVVAEPTKYITLHKRQLDIANVSITNPSLNVSEELSSEYEAEREFLILSRKNGQLFVADNNWKLTIIYSGKLRSDNGGFYMSTYIDGNNNTRYLATTQFESTDARHAFPCYDEPNKRANFTITIIHSPTLKAISNMPVNEASSSNGVTKFFTTPRISTYIVAFIVSDFEDSMGVLDNLPQHVYTRPNAKHTHDWAVVSSMLITQQLAKYYGVKFMLPKLDHVAVPDFAPGGMENFGLATYREEYLLYDEGTSTVFSQTSIANILAHEICHQWFGDYVAVEWWTYLWLKEGFATLFSFKALDDAYPEWGVWQEFHVSSYQGALRSDGNSKNPTPMTHYVQKPYEIAGRYDRVSYAKSGSVLHMWNHALTEKIFQRGLHIYLTTNQYSSAVEGQLFNAIQKAAKEENYSLPATIAEMMSSWTQQGGYPFLNVTRDYESGSFMINQKTFYIDETFDVNKLWYVPINYAFASNDDFRNTEATHYLLKEPEMKIDSKLAKGDWLLLNKQSTSYYRVLYDKENYKLLTEALIKRVSKIHPRNRAQLMEDAYYFTVSNRLDHATLLELMSYLENEDEYAAWATANMIFNTFYFYLHGDQNYNDFRFFIADQVDAIYEKLGVNDIAGEQHYEKYTRNLVINLACMVGVEDCLHEANSKLKASVENNASIEPNLQSIIYCNGLRQSGDKEFNFFYNQCMYSTDATLRKRLLTNLGCSENTNHIKKVMESFFDQSNELHIDERYSIIPSIYSRSEKGFSLCIDFLKEHWNAYGNSSSGSTDFKPLHNEILGMARYVVNKDQEKQLLELVSLVKGSDHVRDTLEVDVMRPIAVNFKWLSVHRDPLMSWFTNYRVEKLRNGSATLAASIVLISFCIIKTIIHPL